VSEEITVPKAVLDLVQRYEAYRQGYLRGDYNETQLRREFVDPIFRALGWDVDNSQGFAEAYKEVVHEQTIRFRGMDTSTKFIDYSFRLGGVMKFIVEAKKPSVKIADVARHDKMVTLVERMLDLNKRLPGAGTDQEQTLIRRQIASTDKEIDELVYDLYGLTDEEIAIVEPGNGK
jgi:hypothetical protein